MIREKGLYVLMGSKPMSTFSIDNVVPEVPEERKQRYETLIQFLQKEKPNHSPPAYEEFCATGKKNLHLQCQNLWKAWKQQPHQVLAHFKFTEIKTPFGEGKEGLFINIPSSLHVLEIHYDSFARITDMNFDPETILNEISDVDSIFWKKAFQSHYLTGLLFGYGERNAAYFDWETRLSLPTSRMNEIDWDQLQEIAIKSSLKPSDLQPPFFSIYSIADPTLEKYKKEREHIVQTLTGSNWIAKIKDRLLKPT